MSTNSPEAAKEYKTSEGHRNSSKRDYVKNREARLAYNKAYREKNKEWIKQKREEKHALNPNRRKAISRKYWDNNKSRIISRIKKTYQENIEFRISKTFRNRLNTVIKLHLTSKSESSFSLLGCSVKELLLHLESLWKMNMSWDNYGYGENKWVIDHIRPCCSFDLTDPIQQKECFHYKNLQPLWWVENMKKGGRYE